ncbi:hypothetical protein HDU85_004054 [Gaertneriomyces sp. JEL0708]|nr:hypothetical protein HDU85_004054 [Gaertneriomyces sp. JEL0708]
MSKPTAHKPLPQQRYQRPPTPAEVQAQAAGMTGNPPDAASIQNSFRRLPPRTRLWLSLGLFAFSGLGLYATSKLEEWYPIESKTTMKDVPADAKSRVDVLWEQEEKELDKLDKQRNRTN